MSYFYRYSRALLYARGHRSFSIQSAVGQWFDSTMEHARLFSSGVEQLFYSQRVDGSIPSKDTPHTRVHRLVVRIKDFQSLNWGSIPHERNLH